MATTVIDKTVSGLFFRNPFYKKYFDLYSLLGGSDVDMRGSVNDIEKPTSFIGIVGWLLNSRKKIESVKKFIDETDNAAGYSLWSVRSPLYFKREIRELHHSCDNYKIISKGYNLIDEPVGGRCQAEHTAIYMREGNRWKKLFKGSTRNNKGYHMTYKFVVEDFLRSGEFKNS